MNNATHNITAATAKPLTMASIKGHIRMAAYYTRDDDESYDNVFVKGAALESYAATLAGRAVEIAHSGNSNGLAKLRAKIDSATLAKKYAHAATLGTVLAFLENTKAAHLKSADITAYSDFAESTHGAIMGIFVTPKAAKPATVPVNWKARALAAEAMVQALKIDIAQLTGKPVPVPTTPEPALM